MEGSILGNIIAGALLLFLGGLVAFGGYRLFLVLLPIYGFFFGLPFGAPGRVRCSATGSSRRRPAG